MIRLFLAISMLYGQTLIGQSISNYVITSAGAAVMSSEGAIYLSIGEPMNTELTNGDIMISQGFLQVSVANRILNTEDLLEEQITIYPNPTQDYVQIAVEDPNGNYTYQFYGVNGEKLSSREQVAANRISLSHLDAGIYFMTIHKDKYSSQTLQIIKQ